MALVRSAGVKWLAYLTTPAWPAMAALFVVGAVGVVGACSSFSGDAAEADAGGVVPDAGGVTDAPTDGDRDAGPKRMFLSAGSFTGDFVTAARSSTLDAGAGGLAAADAICESEGSAVGPGPW